MTTNQILNDLHECIGSPRTGVKSDRSYSDLIVTESIDGRIGGYKVDAVPCWWAVSS